MEIEEKKPEQEIALIISSIIDGYEKQNSGVVSFIHSEILSDLSCLKLMVHGSLKNLKVPDAEKKQVFELIDKIIADLRIIHNEVFPKILNPLGLRKCLRSFANDCEGRYNIHVDHEDQTDLGNQLAFSMSEQLNILRLYKSVLIRLICEHGAIVIHSKLSEKDGGLRLQFQIVSKDKVAKEYGETFLVEKLDSILARVFSLQAEIGEKSDWENFVDLIIPAPI